VSFSFVLCLYFRRFFRLSFHPEQMKILIIGLLLILPLCTFTIAAGPAIWSVNSRNEVLKGDANGVSIDSDGTITIAPQLIQVFKTEQPYIWSSAADAAGNIYLGTGSDGKVYKVNSSGKGSVLADLAELNVSALAIGKSGEIFAASSPDGKVYRIDNAGKADVYFDPREKYIWSLAVFPDGGLAVATGDSGKIYRVRSAGAVRETSLLFDSNEINVTSLAVDKQGNLFAGTDPSGLVLKFSPDGKPFSVLDSPLREIHDIAVGPDNSVYALALGDSTAPVATKESAPPEKPEGPTANADRTSSEPPQKSRYDLSGIRSAVYRIFPDGGNDILWSSPAVTAFSIHANSTGNGVIVGTSDRGRIYNVTNDARDTLVLQSDAGQISTILQAGNGLFATSSNQGNLYSVGGNSSTEGTYESEVLDAKTTATWGRIWWRSSGSVQIQTRSGNTEKPDDTWSTWSSAFTDPVGGQITSPRARYVQWRSVLRSGKVSASLSEVNLAYLSRNIAPEVLRIQVLPTNVGLLATPPAQVDPNIEASGLDPITFGIAAAAVPPRRVFQRNATSLIWTAEDRNGDKLVFDIFYKQVGDARFELLKENATDTFYTIDGLSLADGHYIFKIVAKDSPSNPIGSTLSGERVSEPVDIDNTAPSVTVAVQPVKSGENFRVTFEASDAASYVSRAEYSINSGEWLPVYADDGVTDGPRETFTINVPAVTSGQYSITFRAFDANGNSGNARAIARK
jgi:sugar lactone lactonase YvrE